MTLAYAGRTGRRHTRTKEGNLDMTTIRTFTAPIFSAAVAIALTFAMVGAAVNSPAQSPLHVAAVSTEHAA